jgi:hypothetical protein
MYQHSSEESSKISLLSSAKELGGYFEIEVPVGSSIYHDSAIAVNSGRNALELILRANSVKKLWIPYYVCGAVLQPLARLNIEYDFYYIGCNLEPFINFDFKDGEFVLYVNYFGMKDRFICEKVGHNANVIIDNSQAFYYVPEPGMLSFYSPRKYFGVPDGGFAYCSFDAYEDMALERDTSFDRVGHLVKRLDLCAEEGFDDFKGNEKGLKDRRLLRMSRLTERLLSGINYEKVRDKRSRNFAYVHEQLRDSNELTFLCDVSIFACPMIYPYLTKDTTLRNYLIRQKVYVAQYWGNVLDWLPGPGTFEEYLVKNMVPIPIDQRYDVGDMARIVQIIKEYDG